MPLNENIRNVASGGPWITEKEISYVTDACENGWYDNWDGYIKRFQSAMGEFTENEYAIATSSCTGALHLAMKALGIGPGDEVVVPEVSWIATVTCVSYVGATPVFVDVEPDTWCLDPQAFKSVISERTKAVIPVHMYGHPADMDTINAIAKPLGISVIEDAAPGIGSKYKGKPTGSLGLASSFSFQGAKPLVTGEGGMLLTNDPEFYSRAYYYSDHCRDLKQVLFNTDIGYKYKISNIQAALGLAQVERANEIIAKRRQIFFWYKERLGEIEGLRMNIEREDCFNNFYVPTIILEEDFAVSPKELMEGMDKKGVKNRPFFRAMSKFPMFTPASTPVADHLASRGINLPAFSKMEEADVDYAASVVRSLLLNKGDK